MNRAESTTFSLDWRASGLRYFTLGHYLRGTFGRRVWKVSVDGGFHCPNADGTVSKGGCVFCNINSFSPSRRLRLPSITDQIEVGIDRLRQRRQVDRFIAYFQPATNTYAPVDRLRALYCEALAHPAIVGIAVGTRPDTVSDEALDLLADLAQRTWLSVEYGVQTIHDRSLRWMNRGHGYDAFLDAHSRSRKRGLKIGVHLILGIPGETPEDMLATAREMARCGIDSVKLHNLYAVKNTPLAKWVESGEVVLPSRDEYVRWVADVLEALPPHCVIDRLNGDAPPNYLVGPQWSLDKSAIRAAIEAELNRRRTWQGRLYSDPTGGPSEPDASKNVEYSR
jgi:radical SAM protein (TIGR01212 family)